MPFLRDEGPPIPPASIQRFRESLPTEYGWQLANETGREVLVVRVPKAKPDYLHDLAEVAFYVGLDVIRSTKDVLLIGHEKTARLEPQLLRDHIRAQAREDAGVVEHLRRSLDRQYGHTFVQSPSNHAHNAFAVRIPKETVAQFTPEDVSAIRQLISNLRPRVMTCQYAYIIANSDNERLGRRVLLELIGEGTAAPAPAEPASAPLAPAPVAEPPLALPSLAPAAAPAARTMFPSATPTAAPAAHAAFPTTPVTAAPAPAPAPVATPTAAPTSTSSLFARLAAAVPTDATAAPPAMDVAAAAPDVTVHDEYEIVSKPKAAAPPPPATPAPTAPAAPAPAMAAEENEYEIVSKPKAAPVDAPAPTAAPAPAVAAHDEPERTTLHADKEFEVFVSKPKPRVEGPAITPPGMGGFQAALQSSTGPAPARTKEYEMIGRTSVTSDPSIGTRLKLPGATPAPPVAHFPSAAAPAAAPAQPVAYAPAAQPAAYPPPAAQPAASPFAAHVQSLAATAAPPPMEAVAAPFPPRVANTSTLPPADNGATIVARVAPAAPELILAQRFRESGYEIVEGLRAQGTVFAFAAHRPNGRRVLVKRAPSFAAEEAATLAQLVAALGADVALVVADDVKPGARLATWGTRIEVVTPGDVPGLGFKDHTSWRASQAQGLRP